MSEVENIEEPEANPYNAKKSWHTPDRPNTDDADSLFFAPQATQKRPLMKKCKRKNNLVKELIIKSVTMI